MGRTCTNVRELAAVKHLGISLETARLIHGVWTGTKWYRLDYSGDRNYAMRRICGMLGSYNLGVSYLGTHKRTGYETYFCDLDDPQLETLVFLGHRLKLAVPAKLIMAEVAMPLAA